MKDPFDWDGQEDGGAQIFQSEDWPEDDFEADTEDDYDGFYSHDCMEDEHQEEYPEDEY